jgi:SulP family sulfate permease
VAILKRPNWRGLKSDLSGGLAGALVSMPQSMGMGIVAFAPLGSAYTSLGLMAGLMGGIIVTACSSLFGGTPGLISGPRASVSLVFAAIVASLLAADFLFDPGTDMPRMALNLALIALMAAGALQIAFGLCRFGDAIKFVPYPVIAGFLNAAAILIVLGQLRVIFELPTDVATIDLWRFADREALIRAGLAAVTVTAIFTVPRLLPQVPGLLSGAAVGAALYYALHAASPFLDLGPTLPSLPGIALNLEPLTALLAMVETGWRAFVGQSGGTAAAGLGLDMDTLWLVFAILVPGAVSIALLQSFDSLFSATALDDLTQHRSNGKRELIAQGAGTMLGAGLGFLGGSGSMARTMPCFMAGGRTAWAGLACAVFMLAAILLLAPVVAHIPTVVVAGVLFAVAIELFDKWTLRLLKAFRANGIAAQRAALVDLSIVALVVGIAMTFGLVEAVAVGMAVATAEFVMGVGRSPVRRSYRGDAVSSFLQRDGFSAALLSEHGAAIGILEIEGPFFFGSAGKIEREVDRLAGTGIRHVILDFKRVTSIDSTASRTLVRVFRRLETQGKTLHLSYLAPDARGPAPAEGGTNRRQPTLPHENWLKLRQFGAFDTIGAHHVLADTDTAMRECEMLLLGDIAQDAGRTVTAWQPLADLFDELTDDEKGVLLAFSEERRFGAGSTIFEQGDPGDALYILMDGKVDVILHHAATGRRIRVNTMTRGAVFGEMAILDPQPRSASIIAMEDTTCYRITAPQLESLNEEHPALGLRVMKYLCLLFTTRLRMANLAIIELDS